MSWQILIDNDILYDTRLDEYKVLNPKLTLELNKADSFSCTAYPTHPNYAKLKKFKPTITVKNGDEIISRSRILDDALGWDNEKRITTEGVLSWFNDSVQRPFDFPVDDEHTTPADYFAFLLNRHNQQSSRQVLVGNVTVTDPNNYIARSDSQYSSTYKLLKEGLLDTHGGYLVPRYENGAVYLDYLADFSTLANQPVEFGLNLLTLKTERKGADIATAILPIGKADEETKERLTIADLPDSETDDICKEGDIVYSKVAETMYGSRILAVIKWDDVTVALNLQSKAVAELGVRRQMPSTVTLTAADLSAAGYDFNTFSLGTYVAVTDPWHEDEHGLASMYLVKKLVIDLENPANNTLTLGATTMSFTEMSQQSLQTAMQTVEARVTEETAESIREVDVRTQSAISQMSESIMVTVSEQTYLKGEVDDMISEVSTEIETTANGLNIKFSSLEQDIDDVAAGADAKFNSLQSYIQLAGGAITLGEVGNEVTLKVENDRIGIYSNGVLITYWTSEDFVSPKSLTIPVGGRLKLGSFAFIPRSSGSLDFTWVGA